MQLLEDLAAFHPDIVAIMITGYANQATPLDAMRMGVRDYLDKNHDLSRETFLHAVKRQLDHIRPTKRARQLHESLVAFREAVAKVVPLVQSASALQEPVPLSGAVRGLVRFLREATGSKKGVLLVRRYDEARQPTEVCRAYDDRGEPLNVELVPFARSLAGTAVSMQEACVVQDLSVTGTLELQPFEQGHDTVLAVPMTVGPGVHAIVELLDKQKPDSRFSADDKRLAQAAAALGADLLQQALGQRQTQQLLLDAVAAALGAGEQMALSLGTKAEERLEQPPPDQILDQLRQGLSAGNARAEAEESLRLAEAIRVLALKYGAPALAHCQRLVEATRTLLDHATEDR